MNKKKIILSISALVLVILLGCGIVVTMRIYPVLHAANYISSKLNTDAVVFNIEINLDTVSFTDKQNAFAETLTKILGAEPENNNKVRLEGTFNQEALYAKIYYAALEQPLTEIYSNEKDTLINVEMIYSTIRERIIEQSPILGMLAPKWQDGSYMTLSQAEQIFGMDISEIMNTISVVQQEKQNTMMYYIMMIGMSYEKLENGIRLNGTSEYGTYRVELDEKNDLINIELEDFKLKKDTVMKSCNVNLTFENDSNIIMPEDNVSDSNVELIQGIWNLISGSMQSFDEK